MVGAAEPKPETDVEKELDEHVDEELQVNKVLVIQSLLPTSLAILDRHPDVRWEMVDECSPSFLAEKVRDAAAITVRTAPLPQSVLENAPKLKVISRHGVGYDNLPVDYCTSRKIAVTVVGDANSTAVAEHAMFLILASAKLAIKMDAAVREGDFSARLRNFGLELNGRTLLIVGCGRIGRKLSPRACAFGMKVVFYDPYIDQVRVPDAEFVPSLEDGLKCADVVSLHVPLTPQTQNMLSARELDILPPNAIVVNAGRGGLIDEGALLERIKSGKIHGAGLDTFAQEPLPQDSPLTEERRVVISPHSASLTKETLQAMGDITVHNALDGIFGRLNPSLVVNPEVLD